jgi:hypothetical protein
MTMFPSWEGLGVGFNHPLSKILNLRLGLSIPSVSSAKWRIIHLPLTKGRSFFVRHSDREVDDVHLTCSRYKMANAISLELI